MMPDHHMHPASTLSTLNPLIVDVVVLPLTNCKYTHTHTHTLSTLTHTHTESSEYE